MRKRGPNAFELSRKDGPSVLVNRILRSDVFSHEAREAADNSFASVGDAAAATLPAELGFCRSARRSRPTSVPPSVPPSVPCPSSADILVVLWHCC